MCYYIGGVSEITQDIWILCIRLVLDDASGPDGERSPWKWQS